MARLKQSKPAKLEAGEVRKMLARVPGWKVQRGVLCRTFAFEDYHEVMAFVNATAWVSHRENHHPDMEVGYNKVTMKYVTHDAGGITAADIACAGYINGLGG